MRKGCLKIYSLVKGHGIYNTDQLMTFVAPVLPSGILSFTAECTEHVVDFASYVTSTAAQQHLGI